MVQNFEFKDGYGFYKLRPSVGRSKMTNRLHASPVVEESMAEYDGAVQWSTSVVMLL